MHFQTNKIAVFHTYQHKNTYVVLIDNQLRDQKQGHINGVTWDENMYNIAS